MKTSVDLDDDLVLEVNKTVDLVKEKSATVLRMAIRAGLPLVANRFQATRPDGYFADAYPSTQERTELENTMAKTEQRPERWKSASGQSTKLDHLDSRKTIGL